jgi:hypothetical protein
VKISAALDKAKNQHKKNALPDSGRAETKTEALSAVGIDIRRANEAEKIAAMPEEAFEARIAETKINADLLYGTL